MTFLPIVERELRRAARQRVTHRMRWMVAGLALIIWFALAFVGGNLTTSQRAEAIFGTISVLSLGLAMLAGVFLTADSLSEERREGTLGLLFLTDLKGHDVVLGKLASTSLHAVYGLLAVVPMLAIPLLMGGVTPGEFGRTALVLLVTLFLSLSAGMFVSAFSHDSRVAFLRTFGIMLLLSGILPMLWWGQRILYHLSFDFLLWPSPGYALYCAGDAAYGGRNGLREFWVSLAVIGGMGMMFLVVSSLWLPRVWQQAREEAGGQPRPRTGPMRINRTIVSPIWLESKPYYWLAMRDQRMGRWARWIIGGLFLIWLCFFAGLWATNTPAKQVCFSVTLLLSFALHVILKCLIATEATGRLSEDKQSGALELLLVTPLPPAAIIAGQKLALRHLFRWPRWMLGLMNLLMFWLILGPNPIGIIRSDKQIFAMLFLGGIVLLIADCFVIGSVGIKSALTTKRHTHAILKTLRNVLLPSWPAFLFVWFFLITANRTSSETRQTVILLWIGFGLAVDGILLAIMRPDLESGFRELAATGQSRKVGTTPHMAP